MSVPPPSSGIRKPSAAADSEDTAHSNSDAPLTMGRGEGQSRADGGGPEPRTAAADPGQSDSAAHALLAPASILHRHALESIFAFLELSELAAALRVSRDWLAAVGLMRRLQLEVRRPAAAALVEMTRSLMGRHVSSLWAVRLDTDALAVLADRMAHLRCLHYVLQLPLSGRPLIFPANLRRLQIHMAGPAGAADISAALGAIGRLSLLEELTVWPLGHTAQLSFAPLAGLPRLRSLSVWPPKDAREFSDAQVDELRALPRLQQLNVHPTLPLLRRLLRQPHNLQWQNISLPDLLNDEAAALLPQLPTLTVIERSTSCSRFDWLARLPNLRDVRLSFEWPKDAAARADSLVAGLRCCTKIEILELSDCADLTADRLANLLPRLPQLRELRLHCLRVDSLSFLAQPPLTSQLRRLELWHCLWLPPGELRHVHSLRGLTKLELVHSFTAPLDSAELALLEPPSAVMPRLDHFRYSAAN